MKLETSLNHQNRAIGEIKSLYLTAKYCGLASDTLHADYSKILQSIRHCPQWVTAYCDGYRQALKDSLYANSLMFGGYYKGEFYSTHRERPDYYAAHDIPHHDWNDSSKVKDLGHYWKTTSKPMPYFISPSFN